MLFFLGFFLSEIQSVTKSEQEIIAGYMQILLIFLMLCIQSFPFFWDGFKCVVSNEGYVMLPHFFEQGLQLNEVLETVVEPCIGLVCNGRLYVFQQDAAQSCQTCEVLNLSDLNPLNYYMWSIVERETNRYSHNTTDLLKSTITKVMYNIHTDHEMHKCQQFSSCIEAKITDEGIYIE